MSCSYWAAIKTTGFPIILARFFGKAGSPSSVPGCARSTFPVGEGFLRRGYDTGHFLRRGMIPAASSGGVLQDQPFQGFFQVFLVYAGIIDDQAVQVCGLGIKGAEGLDLQALGEECLGQGFVRQACIHFQ